MKFVAAKCPNCSASIQVDEDTRQCFCQFCGSQIFVEEAIQMIKGTVQIDFKNQIDNFLIRANEFMEQKRYSDAEIYFNKILDIDATNKEAKEGLFKVESIITSPNLFIERGKIRPTGEGKTYLYINKKVQGGFGQTCKYYTPSWNTYNRIQTWFMQEQTH